MRILNMEIPDWVVWLSAGLIIYELSKKREEQSQEPALEGDVMTCAAWQAFHTEKGPYVRCLYYEPTCADGECRTEPVPYPPSIVKIIEERDAGKEKPKTREQEEKEFQQEVQDVARMMAKEENEFLEQGKDLYRRILEHGGIRPYRGGQSYALKKSRGPEYEEYQEIPKYLHRKKGMTIDDMATEMGYKDERDFLDAIESDKYRRLQLPKGRNYWRIADFLPQAEKYLIGLQRAA